jgi:hypothetical protein
MMMMAVVSGFVEERWVSGVSQTVRHLAGSDQIKGKSKLLFCVNHAKMGQNRSLISAAPLL